MDKFICIPVGAIQTNCCIIETDRKNAIVIDPGDYADRILAAADGLDIKKIVLTHGHYDHVRAVYDLVKETGAQVYIHTLDEEMILNADKNLANRIGVSYTPVKPDVLLEDGDIIRLDNIRLEVIHTPGHTKGSIVLKSDGVLYCGDTLFTGSCGRTDLYGGDYSQILNSLKRLGGITGDYVTVSGHGSGSTLAEEKRTNPYLKGNGI